MNPHKKTYFLTLSRSPLLLFSFLLFVLFASFSPKSSHAVTAGNVQADLISEYLQVVPGQEFYLAIHLNMNEGWHTYWRNSGDSGGPTRVEWDSIPGLSIGDLEWPFPHKIETPPLVSYGYEEEVLLFSKAKVEKGVKAGPLNVKAHVRWLECADVCIPAEKKLSLVLPVSNEDARINGEWAEKFSYFKNRLPIETDLWTLAGKEDPKFFMLEAHGEGNPGKLQFFPNDQGLVYYSGAQSQTRLSSGVRILIPKSDILTKPAERLEGILVSQHGWRGPDSESSLKVNVDLDWVDAIPSGGSLWFYLLLAFLGGIILNLMPCVLPVLSIKILGLIESRGGDDRSRLLLGGAYTVGVLFSFWLLALALILIRSGGEKLGWGFQLQNPIFVGILCGVFVALGLNLLGVFEIGTQLAGVRRDFSSKGEVFKSFSTGILATIVATPCTAPFMGVALGFALTQPLLASLAIFTALGLGLAGPYLLLSIFPRFVGLLPKPGPWMEIMKKIFSLLLIGTAAWLAWVFWIQTNYLSLMLLTAGIASLSMACVFFGRGQKEALTGKSPAKLFLPSLVLLGIGLVLVVISPRGNGKDVQSLNEVEGMWGAFSPAAVQEHLSQGRPVFVDFTAAWCLTCQVNERVVFSRDDVQNAFAQKNVVMLKADWTSKDPVITKSLEELGRSGVPVYALYRKQGELPILLPPLLTPGIVKENLSKIENR